MRRWLMGLMVALVAGLATAPFMAGDAEAKRLGGGKSMGKQSNSMQRQDAPPANQASPSQAPGAPTAAAAPGRTDMGAAAQPARNRWLGPVAGLAAGLGLAALASHLGIGEELMSLFMIVGLVMLGFIVFRLLMARRQGGNAQRLAYAGAGAPMRYEDMGRETVPPPAQAGMGASGGMAGWGAPAAAAAVQPVSKIPAGFDVEGFLKVAKENFVHLQKMNDAGRLEELVQFTTIELYNQLREQVMARGSSTTVTEVLQLDAELLGVEQDAREHQASVRFRGLVREDVEASAESFDEIWVLTKPADGSSGWVLAGIQQLQ